MKGKLALCLCVWCSVHRNVALIKCHECLLLKPCQMAEYVGWHFFFKWSLAARKGETMKWPNYGHRKAKEHSWLPALLFSPQVFLIACKRAASLFLLLACQWQRSVKEPSHGSACSPSAFFSADIGMFCLTACICAAVCAISPSELFVSLLKSCIGFCCTDDHRSDFLQLCPFMGQGEKKDWKLLLISWL